MDLWIRRQDKRILQKVNEVWIRKDFSIATINNIKSEWGVDVVILGKYATEERALEVLDEIQNKLQEINYEFGGQRIEENTKIYEMPKE